MRLNVCHRPQGRRRVGRGHVTHGSLGTGRHQLLGRHRRANYRQRHGGFQNLLIVPNEVTSLPTSSEQRMFVVTAAELVHAAFDFGIAVAAWEDAIDYGRNRARPVADSRGERAAHDPYGMHTGGEVSVLLHTGEAMLKRAHDTLDHAAEAQASGHLSGNELQRVLVEGSIAVAEAKAAANAVSVRLCEQMYVIAAVAINLRHFKHDHHWRNPGRILFMIPYLANIG